MAEPAPRTIVSYDLGYSNFAFFRGGRRTLEECKAVSQAGEFTATLEFLEWVNTMLAGSVEHEWSASLVDLLVQQPSIQNCEIDVVYHEAQIPFSSGRNKKKTKALAAASAAHRVGEKEQEEEEHESSNPIMHVVCVLRTQ